MHLENGHFYRESLKAGDNVILMAGARAGGVSRKMAGVCLLSASPGQDPGEEVWPQ